MKARLPLVNDEPIALYHFCRPPFAGAFALYSPASIRNCKRSLFSGTPGSLTEPEFWTADRSKNRSGNHEASRFDPMRVRRARQLFDIIHENGRPYRRPLSPSRIKLKMAFAALETEMRQDDILGGLPPVHELLADSTKAGKAGLTNRFVELYPIMREYVENRCFG